MTAVPTDKVKQVMAATKAIHAQEDYEAAPEKVEAEALKLEGNVKRRKAAEIVRAGFREALGYYGFPGERCRSLRINNPLLQRIPIKPVVCPCEQTIVKELQTPTDR